MKIKISKVLYDINSHDKVLAFACKDCYIHVKK